MKKLLIAILLFCSISAFCQESNISDTLRILLQKRYSLLDSVMRVLERRDDSIYSILNDLYKQHITIDTFNYEQTRNDYLEFIKHYGNDLQSGTFQMNLPIDSVLNKSIIGFGNKLQPVYKIEKPHLGIDIPAPKGKSIKSTIAGKVLSAKEINWREGNQVIIQGNKNIKFVFSHLNEILVKEGETIKVGQIIGFVGSSGMSVASHLHYEIIIDDVPVNPIFIFFKRFTKEDLEYIFTKNCQSLD
jgi:murein DD-endopeptidase MepM/ murein hydrolase activator NlpD